VHPVTIPYEAERLVKDQLVVISIPSLLVPKCDNCGEVVFNESAECQVLRAAELQVAVDNPSSWGDRCPPP
jgi:hypothetical protein